MPEDRNIAVDEEISEYRYETDRLLHRTATLLAKLAEMHKRSEEAHSKRMAELDAVLKKVLPEAAAESADFDDMANSIRSDSLDVDKAIKEMIETHEWCEQKIREADLKYGYYTDSLDELEIRRILNERFDAEYRGEITADFPEKGGLLEIDAMGLARNDVEAAYLVIVRNQFESEDIEHLLRQVELFRDILPWYRQYALFPVVATEQIGDEDRQLVWDAGMYLINIDYRDLEFVEPPADFIPNGNHGLQAV